MIRCPGCGSAEVVLGEEGGLLCVDCGKTFLPAGTECRTAPVECPVCGGGDLLVKVDAVRRTAWFVCHGCGARLRELTEEERRVLMGRWGRR